MEPSGQFAGGTRPKLMSLPDPPWFLSLINYKQLAADIDSYDGRNRLPSKQTPFGTLSCSYDDAGSIKTLRSSNANGVSVDYSYDELNRLSAAKDNRLIGNQTTTYTFDAVGNLQSYTYPNQVTTSYAYNDLNRLTV